LSGAAKSVGRPLFFSLLVITVSFIPVFSLTAQEGRLFKPLAFTKTFAMFFAAVLGITVVPVLMLLLVRGQNYCRNEKSGEPVPDLGLPALGEPRAALPLAPR
jgi:Cu/Ag efflux pump CusA